LALAGFLGGQSNPIGWPVEPEVPSEFHVLRDGTNRPPRSRPIDVSVEAAGHVRFRVSAPDRSASEGREGRPGGAGPPRETPEPLRQPSWLGLVRTEREVGKGSSGGRVDRPCGRAASQQDPRPNASSPGYCICSASPACGAPKPPTCSSATSTSAAEPATAAQRRSPFSSLSGPP
jgi:hypothetical protein